MLKSVKRFTVVALLSSLQFLLHRGRPHNLDGKIHGNIVDEGKALAEPAHRSQGGDRAPRQQNKD